MFYGAVETGGTKIICAKFSDDGQLVDSLRFLTTSPEAAVQGITEYFWNSNIAALGIGSFGPVDIDPASSTYGSILDTPKKGWSHYPFLDTLQKKLHIPVAIDTDVNCACIGEMRYGAARNTTVAIYITIGTGIGVGVGIGGETLKGMLHPEAGHILIRKRNDDTYAGCCPYHKDCFEGLASGPAIGGRAGRPAYEISENSSLWELEADYIAQALADYILVYSPEKIVLGGGVMEQKQLLPLIREKVKEHLGGYIRTAQVADMDSYIVPAELDGNQGILGAFCIARKAVK